MVFLSVFFAILASFTALIAIEEIYCTKRINLRSTLFILSSIICIVFSTVAFRQYQKDFTTNVIEHYMDGDYEVVLKTKGNTVVQYYYLLKTDFE